MKTLILNVTLMRRYLTISMILFSSVLMSQEVKKEAESVKTKMDVFTSKTGVITKFVDSNLSGIKASYGEISETRIRKIISGVASIYFFQIVKKGKYNDATASIEYADLLEVIKALKSLKTEIEKDVLSNPDYLENKFTTVDGFQIGYYVSKGKTVWYLKLDKYGSDNTLFINNVEVLETAFEEGKQKIEELKKT